VNLDANSLPNPDASPTAASDSPTSKEADEIVKRYMLAALGVGFISVPVLDVAALTAIQLGLLSRLASLYKVDFSHQRGKSVIASLVGGGTSTLASVASTRFVLRLLCRLVSVPGWIVGATSMSLFAGASTYAIGHVFIQHFDSGGTFLTFDPDRVRQYYAEALARGREEVQSSFAGVKP
jgi:uncharacterized protein (DUF697 family)